MISAKNTLEAMMNKFISGKFKAFKTFVKMKLGGVK